ncbi:hypothetical protein [Beijerinckia sp. L45]|uniref:hypothetical protein n=1 Tax=Beijerinckia sp. L45 TaxID=1641855 RepID=UPI00131CC010|nr:hypothetical protein [Beijerinckia sp. L45]
MTADALVGTKTVSVAAPVIRAEWRAVQGVAVFLVFLLISIIPLLTHPLPPLEDYANHVSRMYVIADAGKNANLAKFYEIDWELLPNLMMDLIVPQIARYVNVYLACQLFTIGIFVLIMSGTFALNRALFKRWSVLPLIAFPLLYNYIFLVGVMNYFCGIGLALWGLAAWIALRERPWPYRYVISALFAILLFLCHLFTLGVYGLGLMAFEIWFVVSVDRSSLPLRALKFVCAGIPFIPALLLLVRSSTWGNATAWEWDSLGKIDGLIYAVETYSDIVAVVLTVTVVLAGAWAARHKILRVHPFLMPLLIVGGIIYMAMPRVLFASYLADQRLPIAIIFMVVACFRVELRQEFIRRLFLLGTMALLGARVAEVDIAWANSSTETLEMKESLRKVAKGSKILVAYTDSNMPNEVEHLGLVHAATLAILERSSLITTAFTTKGKQIMHVRPDYRKMVDTEDGVPPTIDQLVLDAVGRSPDDSGYWHDWINKYDYIYVLFTDDDSDNPMPDKLKSVYEGENFQLYHVIRPGMDPSELNPPKPPKPMTRISPVVVAKPATAMVAPAAPQAAVAPQAPTVSVPAGSPAASVSSEPAKP